METLLEVISDLLLYLLSFMILGMILFASVNSWHKPKRRLIKEVQVSDDEFFPRYRMCSVGGGKFTVLMLCRDNRYHPFIIYDINIGCGCDEIHPMQGTKSNCELAIKILNRLKEVDLYVHWTQMDRLKNKFGIEYTYLSKEQEIRLMTQLGNKSCDFELKR